MQSLRLVVCVFTTFSVLGTEAALRKSVEQSLRKVWGFEGLGETVRRVLFEEGQSRRRVADGPITGVVVREGVRFEVAEVGGAELVLESVFDVDFVEDLCDCEAPTPPPTAAPITMTEMMAKTIQNVFGARPHSFCGAGWTAAEY